MSLHIINCDEKQLLSMIAQGDEKAFNVLFERHWSHLFNYMMRLTKSPEVTEEIVVDVFLKLWSAREFIVNIQNIDAYLYTMARNKAINFFKLTARNSRLKKEISETINHMEVPGADYRLLDQEAQLALKEAISKLSLQRRLVFTLHRIQGLSNDEIAKKLNLSKQTVKNTMVDAQRSLRQFLKERSAFIFFYLCMLLGI